MFFCREDLDNGDASPAELLQGGRMLCNLFKHQADLFILQYEDEKCIATH